MDHLLDNITQLFRGQISIVEDVADAIFTLVTFCWAASAKLQDFYENIHTEFESFKGSVVEEEQALKRRSRHLNVYCSHLSRKHNVPVEHPHLHLPALCSHQVG